MIFDPPLHLQSNAHVKSAAIAESLRRAARENPDNFWRELSRVLLLKKPFTQVLEWKTPVAKWFVEAQLNVSEQCLDKHLNKKSSAEKTALIWQGEPDHETRRLSYLELFSLTCKIANCLSQMGIKKGDRVALYMPMVPELVASQLACARLGAIHTVIFAGFSAQSVADRIVDSQASLVITADGGWRKGKFLALKNVVDEALKKLASPIVKNVLVFERDPTQKACTCQPGRDHLWSKAVLPQSDQFEAVALDSEDPLFILYTSGTTGKPKGIYHTQAGYILWAHWTSRWIFDLQPQDIYWCTADCGWITGHTYVTYGPLSNGATVMIYEGAPTFPHVDRFWQIIAKHKVSILYTAPTAVRMFMRTGEQPLRKHNLATLRLLGSVGEPINPEAWLWYHEHVGQKRCPIVDTWWQTETGGIMIAAFPAANQLKPGSANQPLPGIEADIVNPISGEKLASGEKGLLVIRRPWPAMARGIWGDPERFSKTYWEVNSNLHSLFVTSDFARRDDDNDFWISGRMDDVLNVAGHRIGSAEIESALVSHPDISEAAAVGVPHAIKGEGIAAFVTLTQAAQERLESKRVTQEELKESARHHVVREIGAHAHLDQIRMAKVLPKTRSGKIMRRLLRELAITGEIRGDTTTLEDFSPSMISSADED